jgi:hypothetical protein
VGPDELRSNVSRRPTSDLLPRPLLVVCLAVAVAAGAVSAAAATIPAPTPIRVGDPGRPAPLGPFTRPSPPLLEVRSDRAHPIVLALAPGNRLVTGYEFTREPDFVYAVDRATGQVLDRLPVHDAPERITRRGDELRIVTYSRSLVVRLRR